MLVTKTILSNWVSEYRDSVTHVQTESPFRVVTDEFPNVVSIPKALHLSTP